MKHSLLSSLFLISCLQAEGLDDYLSEYKRKEFNYDYEKSFLEKKKLRDSWIQPLQLRYSRSKSNPYNEQPGSSEQKTQNAAIVMDQPIFKSGGIYFGIKFAEASYRYNKYSVDVAKRKLIKEALELLIRIKQSDLELYRQELKIDNAQIDLEQKKEQYLNGQLDSGFLNNAIIVRNKTKQAFFDIQTRQETLLSSFRAISDRDPKKTEIPQLDLINEEEYFAHNIDLKKVQSEREMNRYQRNMSISKYLPSVHINAAYKWDKLENPNFGGNSFSSPPETSYYNYGLTVSMPLDFNSLRDIESDQVSYLKSLVLEDDTKRNLKSLYEQVKQNLKNIEKKIRLANENKLLYMELLKDSKVLYQAGYKTEYDVRNMQNSLEIETVDQKIYVLDKQRELLNLYEKIINDEI